MRGSLAERLNARLDRSGDCWLWTGATNNAGYGRLLVNGVAGYAHRGAWIVAYGAIPAGLHVLHTCDVPACCRPSHLWLGTHQENIADRDRKGRTARGQSQVESGRRSWVIRRQRVNDATILGHCRARAHWRCSGGRQDAGDGTWVVCECACHAPGPEATYDTLAEQAEAER